MRRHYFFKKGDILKWYNAFVKSDVYVKTYRYYFSDKKRLEERDKYIESKEIVNEYKVFISSLNEKDKKFFNDFINTGTMCEGDLYQKHPEIIDNWETIVLNHNKHNLKEIDLKLLGHKLKELRELNGFYRVEVARFLSISDKTIEAYEEGIREIPITKFYKLMQLYEVDDITDFFNKITK